MLPLAIARKFETLEVLVPRRRRLPMRFYGQRVLGAVEPELKFLPFLVKKNWSTIDIGANKGLYSYVLSKISEHVYCFEPIEELCNYISAYESEKISILNMALSDFSGKVQLTIPLSGGRKITTRATLLKGFDGEMRQVETRKLDEFGYSNIGFIKIDVEGVEEKVISGGLVTIDRNRPVMMIELAFQAANTTRCRKMLSVLNDLDYRFFLAEDKGLEPLTESIFEQEEYSRNILCIAKEKEHQFRKLFI